MANGLQDTSGMMTRSMRRPNPSEMITAPAPAYAVAYDYPTDEVGIEAAYAAMAGFSQSFQRASLPREEISRQVEESDRAERLAFLAKYFTAR